MTAAGQGARQQQVAARRKSTMSSEIHLINDGDGVAVIGEAGAVERFLASEGLPSKALDKARFGSVLAAGSGTAQAASTLVGQRPALDLTAVLGPHAVTGHSGHPRAGAFAGLRLGDGRLPSGRLALGGVSMGTKDRPSGQVASFGGVRCVRKVTISVERVHNGRVAGAEGSPEVVA